jgi:hypothetical protein
MLANVTAYCFRTIELNQFGHLCGSFGPAQFSESSVVFFTAILRSNPLPSEVDAMLVEALSDPGMANNMTVTRGGSNQTP